ncbi:hypothetical protein NMG60_11034567, partial [Bertholletia excelsa]
ILQWLFKKQEPSREATPGPKTMVREKPFYERAKSKDVIPFNKSKFGCSSFKLFAILRRRDIANTCFYHTLNLKRPGSFNTRQQRIYTMKMKKEDIARGLGITHKADNSGSNKVLPISDGALSSSSDRKEVEEKRNKPKDEKARSISRVKELLRWAASAKSQKGGKNLGRKVLHLRNRATLKAVPDNEQLSNESPKISFRWDVESCSATSSVYSAASIASSMQEQSLNLPSRSGNWITTDSEFVVLEL